MKYKKKDINEIVDTHGDLIGLDDIPTNGSDLETQAKGTSDVNAKIGTQPFRYDMLGRFGFTLMPFMEGEDKNQGQKELLDDLAELMYDRYREFLEYFYKHPQQLKQDYRKKSQNKTSFENDEEVGKKIDYEWAEKALKIFQKHFEKSFSDSETIDEGKVIEDKMVDKEEDKMTSKSEDNEIRDKKIKKIAGLINKLEKKDIDDLINLIERKNG